MLRPGLILWSSAALAALLGCERATPFASSQTSGSTASQPTASQPTASQPTASASGQPTASAEPQQVIAPLVPRALDVRTRAERADAASRAAAGAGAAAGAQRGAEEAGSSRESSPVAEVRSAAQTQSAGQAASGAPSPTCVNGWIAPGRGSPLRKAPLDMIRESKSERFVVLEMRYFRGPEDAEVIGPQREVERWYVKAESAGRNPRRQRWLVRRAEVGRGIDAVADFDSTGHAPGTWKRPDASDDSVSDPFQRPCERPAAGEKCMGLPYAVLGCLDGT